MAVTFFSVCTDASNKSKQKNLPTAVRFFNVNGGGIMDAPTDFREQLDETFRAIPEMLTNSFDTVGLSLEHVVAHGADNALANNGKHCSVFQKLQDQPRLLKANCNCHVLNNTTKHAVKFLTCDVDNLILKVFRDFHQVPRMRRICNLFTFIFVMSTTLC